jgi:hypothetical protein
MANRVRQNAVLLLAVAAVSANGQQTIRYADDAKGLMTEVAITGCEKGSSNTW